MEDLLPNLRPLWRHCNDVDDARQALVGRPSVCSGPLVAPDTAERIFPPVIPAMESLGDASACASSAPIRDLAVGGQTRSTRRWRSRIIGRRLPRPAVHGTIAFHSRDRIPLPLVGRG